MATIAVAMVDGVADWETAPALPAAREWFGDDIRVASIDSALLTSIGGPRIQPDAAFALEADLWRADARDVRGRIRRRLKFASPTVTGGLQGTSENHCP